MAQKGEKRAGKTTVKAASPLPTTLTFDYIKSNHFRVIKVDGVVGGIAPNGETIHMGVFNERTPYPQQVVHEVDQEGALGKEISRKSRDTTFIRELEAGLVFSPEMARVIIRWLERNLKRLSTDSEEEA